MESAPSKPHYRRRILFLFVLSPFIGEVLSGSTPPLAFINPFTIAFLGSLYGSGALLVRDYARRWRKGWRSILLLGAAYGIIEEGILVRSFFSPTWKDLGVLATYGRWLGVNWVWAEWLAIYHAIFSITIPIFLVEQYYPKSKGQIWLTKNLRILFHSLLIASIVVGFFAFPYDAPIWGLAGCVLAVITLGWLAKKIPNTRPVSQNLKLHWRILVPLGFSVPAISFFLFNSAIIPSAIITMIVGALLVLGYERLLSRWSLEGWTDLQRLGLVAGAVFFFAFFFDPVLEFAGRLGTSVAGIGFAVFLLVLRKRVILRSTLIHPIAVLPSDLSPWIPSI